MSPHQVREKLLELFPGRSVCVTTDYWYFQSPSVIDKVTQFENYHLFVFSKSPYDVPIEFQVSGRNLDACFREICEKGGVPCV